MIEEIGTRHVAHISTMVPVLLALLRDSTPAVARRAITSGSNIFRTTLEQVASQGIYTGQVEKQLVDAWNWVTHFKNAVYPAAFQVLSRYCSYFCSATELLYLVNAFL
jgi:symplekin